MRKILPLLLLFFGPLLCAQNVRYDAPFPSISSQTATPFLVANVPPNSPTLAVCHSPANTVPCTNYATTYTSTGSACPNGAQDTPQPQPSACQVTGDAQGNIGFWAPAGTYDYTVCVGLNCYGPYTVTLGSTTGGSPLTTKGDIFVFGSANARLPVGSDGQCLTASSAQLLGLAWASCGSGSGTPGGVTTNLQTNAGAGAFGGITNVAAGSQLVSNGVSAVPIFQLKPMVDVRDYGAVGDGQVATDCWMTASSATLTCASNHFVVGDVGKVIGVYDVGPTSGGLIQTLSSTIQAYVSATQVTLANSASNTTTSTVSTITSCSRSLQVVTCNTSANHNLHVGNMVTLIPASSQSVEETILGTFSVQTVPSGTSFTFNQWDQLDNASMVVTSMTSTGYSSRVVWGTNNDTALANARDAAAGLGHGLYIPGGHYLTHGLQLPCSKVGNWTSVGLGICSFAYNDMAVVGDGIDVTTLENWDIATSVVGVVYIGKQSDQYPYNFAPGGPLIPISGITVRGMTLQQVKHPTQALKSFAAVNADGYVVDHVKVSGWSYEGFYLGGIHYDLHDSIAVQTGLGGPSSSTTTAGLNLIGAWGRVHDNYVYDSGQCIEAGNPHQNIYSNTCDGGGNDIYIAVSPHLFVNISSNSYGTWDVHVHDNKAINWGGEDFENVNGIFKDVTFEGNTMIDDTGPTMGGGLEANAVNVWPMVSPAAHGTSTIRKNTWIDTPNFRTPTYVLQVSSLNLPYVLENWRVEDNTITYTTPFCTTTPFAPTFDDAVCTGGGVSQISAGFLSVARFNPAWSATTVIPAGGFIIPVTANGYTYRSSAGGTTGNAEPAWCTTTGCTVTDNAGGGTVTWTLYGLAPTLTVTNLKVSAPNGAHPAGRTLQEINFASTTTRASTVLNNVSYNLPIRTLINGTGSGAVTTSANTVLYDGIISGIAGHTLPWSINAATGAPSFSGQITSTLTTGTAPLVIASTTNVPNLNASSLNGTTFAAPGPIGSTTPSTGAFTTVSTTGLLTSYDGITTAGLGLPVQVGVARLVSQTGNLGPTTLFTVGGSTSQYLVTATVYCDSSSAAATVALSIGYTDPSNTAQTISPSAAACSTLNAGSLATINSVISAKNATPITYSAAIVNTPTYDVRVEVFQLSSN